MTDSAGKVTTLGYTSGALTSVSRSRSQLVGSPETVLWAVGYTSGKVTSVLDPIGDSTAGDPAHTFGYGTGTTDVNRLVDYGTATRTTTTYTFDDKNRGWSEEESTDGTTIAHPHDDAGLVTSETRPAGIGETATTTYTWDARGNLLTQTTEIDASTTVRTAYSYNATNDLLTISEADDDAAIKLVTRHVYDGAGHLTSSNVNCTTSGTTPPSVASTCTGAGTQNSSTNLITTYTYTANNKLETETDPRGIVTRHAYDTWGNETLVTANYVAGQSATADRNVVTTTAYDQGTAAGKAGLPTSATDPLGRTTTYTYDLLGRQLTEVLPADATIPVLTTATAYDELGNVLTETTSWTPLGGGSPTSRITTHDYDLLHRKVLVTDPAGIETVTEYDAASNPTEVTSAGVLTTREYDALGRLIGETVVGGGDIGNGVTSIEYDDGGSPSTVTASGVDSTLAHTYTGLRTSEVVGGLDPQLHTYDRLGRELTSTSPEGIVTTRTYDRAGRLLTVTVSGGTTTYAYDRAGNQLTVTDPSGTVTTTTYDALGRATTVVGNDVASPSLPTEDVTTTTYYDAAGQVIAIQDAKGITTRTLVNARGLATETIANCTDSGTAPTSDPPACTGAGTHDVTTNVSTTQTYDGSGAVLTSTLASGTVFTAFNAAGQAIATKDALGTITRTNYDAAGRVVETIVNCTTTGTTIPSDWAGCTGAGTQDGTYNLTTTYTYDAHGNQATVTAPNGRVTKQHYDDTDRVTMRTEHYMDGDPGTQAIAGRPDDIQTDYLYDIAGRQAAVITDNADRTARIVTRYLYDDDGRVVREIRHCVDNPVGSPQECTGTDTSASAVRNLATDYVYDTHGNRVKVTTADPSAAATGTGVIVTRYAFDDANRLCRVVENSTQNDATFNGLADRCSTAISGTATTNLSTRYTYDGAGNLASMIDANGNTTSYGYDAAGRMTSRTDALSGTVTYGYDALGNRTRQTNRVDPPLSDSITWTYDAAGRMLTRTADGVTTTYTYDANGNRLTASDGTLTITTTYDRLGRPLTVDDEDAGSTADTTYTYSLTAPGWTDPTGTYTTTLDTLERPLSLNDPFNASDFTWSYGPTGAPLTAGQPNGNTTTYTYDAIGRETARATKAGATNRVTHAATFNRAGQILSATETVTTGSAATTTYGYDPLARLTGYTPPAGSAVTYGWDEVPNRTSVTTGGTPVTTTYDAANRPTSDSAGGAYTHDADGRMTARPAAGSAYQRFEWDDLGRLVRVRPPTGNSTIATYSYDPLDRLRLVDYGGNNRIRFRYLGSTTTAVQTINDQNGTVLRNVATGPGGEPLADWTGAGTDLRIYGRNAHHDVTFTTGAAGTVTATARYDPWGTLAASSGTLPEFGFQGSWTDATTQLLWVVTRWYAPAQGRFLSEDSLLGDATKPASRHLYAYGEGEPVGRWDPDGRWWKEAEQVLNLSEWADSLRKLATWANATAWCLMIPPSWGLSVVGCASAVTDAIDYWDQFDHLRYGGVKMEALVKETIWKQGVANPGSMVRWTTRWGIKATRFVNGIAQTPVTTWATLNKTEYLETFISSSQTTPLDYVGKQLSSHWQSCGQNFLWIRDWGPKSMSEAKSRAYGRCHPWAAIYYEWDNPMVVAPGRYAASSRWTTNRYYRNRGLGIVPIPSLGW